MKKSSRFQVAGSKSRKRAGLTLVEVILALMIIGTGLVALVAAVSRCLSVPRLAMNFDTARELLGQLEAEDREQPAVPGLRAGPVARLNFSARRAPGAPPARRGAAPA